MSISIVSPFAIAVVGVVIFALSSNSKIAEIGKILFFCGALVATMALGGRR